MSELIRFGVSLEKVLLQKFDKHIKKENYANRSNAIADLIRDKLIRQEWTEDKEVAGAIIMVFDHHKRDLVNNLTNIQHDYHKYIISSQHIHLDHDNCFEIVVVKGKPHKLEELANKLKSAKGVKHASLSLATTGKEV
ncbi:MAG: nickel-responsive transcriptional regulator NikR [Candidatus Cloacimonetes bacterium]|jgi:CopG family nickel-responsive transcriptional regulator|nr:nickel-responsive transcriptional regulator NikR [Candidatus Cloacimonadota bacterium]